MKNEQLRINEKMRLSFDGFELLRKLEGKGDGDLDTPELEPYICPSGFWTIGYGHLLRVMGERMHKNNWSKEEVYSLFHPLKNDEEATKILLDDLKRYEGHIISSFDVPLSQCMFDALVLFSFNCWYSETLWNYVKTLTPKYKIVAWWCSHWITCNKVISKGLLKRRITEALIFLGYGYNAL